MEESIRSRDERFRMQHARIENEKEYMRKKRQFENALDDKVTNLTRQEIMIRKQQERLENEKKYNKAHSNLTKDRRLSLVGGGSSESTSKTSQSSLKDVKSKLFDYQKSSPRSRRQLMESGRSPPTSPSPGCLPVHAMEANKATHNEIVNHLSFGALKPGADNGGHDTSRREPSTTPSTTPSILLTDLEERASRRSLHSDQKDAENRTSRRSLHTSDLKELERTSRRNLHQQDHKVTFHDEGAGSSRVHSRETQFGSRASNRSDRRRSEPVPIIRLDSREDDVTDGENDAVKLKNLFNKAIATVQQADETLLTDAHTKNRNIKDRRSSDHKQKSGFDLHALKELEHILNDARIYSSRKSSKEDHSRLDLGSNRAQKKRIEHLEQVLRRLDPKYAEASNEIDPFQMLQCSYLRLSKSNIASLEELIRADGRDPGIHVHSDVTDYNIWTNIENERADVKRSGTESRKPSEKKMLKSNQVF